MLARLLTAALALGGSLTAFTATADAHFCKGCIGHRSTGLGIDRINIKKRGRPSNRVTTTTPVGGTLVSGSIGVLTEEGGDPMPFDPPTNGTVIARGATDARIGDSIGVTLTAPVLDEAGRPTGAVRFTTGVIESLSATDSTVEAGDGWQITARLAAEGRLRVEIAHANPAWGGDGLYRIDHQSDSPGLKEVNIKEIRQTWRAEVLIDGPAIVQFYDNVGTLALRQTHVDVEPDAVPDGVAGYVLDQDDDGRARLTSWTRNPTGSIARLATRILDFDMGDTIAETVQAAPSAYQRSWLTAPIAFQDDAIGFVYTLQVQLFDAEGRLIGDHEVESALPTPVEGKYASLSVGFADGKGQLHAISGPDGARYQVIMDGEGAAPAFATLTFQEPFEGPEPDELEWGLEQIGDWSAWVTVADHHRPQLAIIDIEPLDAEGQPAGVPGYFTVSGAEPDRPTSAAGLIQVVRHGVETTANVDPRVQRARSIAQVVR